MSTRPASEPKRRFFLPRWLRKGRVLIVLGLALVSFVFGRSAWFNDREFVHRFELQAHDQRFVQRGPISAHPDVLVVGVASSSFDQKALEPYIQESEAIRLMHQHPLPPWPRSIHAMVIDRILSSGAKVVAIDFVLMAETKDDPELVEVFRKYPDRIVLAANIERLETDNSGTQFVFLQPNQALIEAAGSESVGYVTYEKRGDEIARWFDYRTSEVRESPSLRRVLGDDDPRDLWKFAALAARKASGRELPTDYEVPINFTGGVNSYPALPVENFFIPHVWETDRRYRKGEAFRNKIVLYGPIAEIFKDNLRTPFGTMPGVEVHANVVANILRGDTLRNAPQTTTDALTLFCSIATAVVLLRFKSAIAQSAGVFGIAAMFWIGTQWAFTAQHTLFPVIPAFFAIAVTGGLGITYQFLLSQWEQGQTRKVLDRSVNKRIAKVMLQNAEEFEHARRGERRPVAILFSDIRSFTTWSERAEPEHLVGQLNEYFERMVELVEREGSLGNAQKFIGDAILAAWGDTAYNRFGDAEDARRAVAVALEMRTAVKELNAVWSTRTDRISISIGMGVNLGDVVVGEVGHPERREYTVLGDGVNFAARLESATKQFHTDCLVGERVEELTRQHFVFRHVDFLRVKGKTKPVNVYFLLSDRTVPAPDWLEDYHRARALYVERRFEEAAALFRAVKERIGGEDFLCDMYAERCDRYAKEPPPADWDGSYTMTEK